MTTAPGAPLTETEPTTTRGSDSSRPLVPMRKAFAWDKGNLVVTLDTSLARLRSGYLSPSTAKAIESCAARWAAEKSMPSREDPFGAAELGTSAHSVLEDLFKLPGRQRTEEQAMLILLEHAKTMWPGRDDESRALKAHWIAEVRNAYRGLWEVEDPTQVVVHSTELKCDGIEIEGVPFKGFIDRVDLTPDGFKVADYKSGKVPSNIQRFGDDHGDQIRLYAEIIRVIEGKMPAEGVLLYTRHGKARNVPLSKPKMRSTINHFKQAWVTLNKHLDNGAFPTKTSPLCGWCPLVNSCPSAQADGKTDRVGGAASKADLGIPVVRTFEAADLTADARRAANRRTPSWDLDFGSASDEPAPEDPEAIVEPSALADPHDDAYIAPETDGDPDASAATPETTPDTQIDSQADTEADQVDQVEEAGVVDAVSVPDPAAHLHVSNDTSTETTETAEHIQHTSSTDTQETSMSDLLAEGKPWEETVNGSLNPASYAATAVFGLASLAYEEVAKAGLPMKKQTIDALALTFASIVDDAQVKMTGVSSFQDASHTRLRGALRTFIDTHPLPFGEDIEGWDAWVLLAKKHLPSIASLAVRLYETALSGEPWQALAIRKVEPKPIEDGFDETA